MKNSNLHNVIVTLSKEEKAAFVKWLKMGNHKIWAESFTKIDQQICKFGPSLEREALCKAFFPDQPFDGQRYRRRLHDILSELRTFAAFREMTVDSLDVEKYWLKFLMRKQLFSLREFYFNKYLKNYQKNEFIPWSGGTTHYDIISYQSDDVMISDAVPNKEMILLRNRTVEEHLLLEILRWQMVLNNYRNIDNAKNEFILGKFIRELLSNPDYTKTPTVELLLLAIEVSQLDCPETRFEMFSKKLLELHPSFDHDLNYSLFVIRANYVARKYSLHGIVEALRQYYELEKERNDLGFAINFGVLPYRTYRNLVAIALGVNEVDWANEYNEANKQYVSEDQRENSYMINKAKILYSKNDYNASLLILNQIELDQPLTYLTVKRYQAQIYYHCGDDEAFQLLVGSTIRTLNRKKSTTYHWGPAVQFFKFLRSLVKLRSKFSEKRKEALLEDIKNHPQTANKKWLLEEVEKLEK